jgi:chemotaxis protein MotB
MPDIENVEKNVQFSVTGEGLRVDLMENAQGTFFVAGSARPSGDGEKLLRLLAAEIGRLPNRIVIEGHSDAQPYRNVAPVIGYGNWELSADRANAVRQILAAEGVPSGHIYEVAGKADTEPLFPDNPRMSPNRRVTITLMREAPPIPADFTP